MEVLDSQQQVADMAAIRARWPRRHWASLDDCGGDDTVQVELVSGERYPFVATKKDDPDGLRGLSDVSAADAIKDLRAMQQGYAELQAERQFESEYPGWSQRSWA